MKNVFRTRGNVEKTTSLGSYNRVSILKEQTTWQIPRTIQRIVSSGYNIFTRPMALTLVLLTLLWFIMSLLIKYHKWIPALGICMILLTLCNAIQDFYLSKVQDNTPSLNILESNHHEKQSLVSGNIFTTETKSISRNGNTNSQVLPSNLKVQKEDCTSSVHLDGLEPTMTKRKRNSISIEEGRNIIETTALNQVQVAHCGTIIEIDGTQGYLIPHNPILFDMTNHDNSTMEKLYEQSSIPLFVSFELHAALLLKVGEIVEFSYATSTFNKAINVQPLHSMDRNQARNRYTLSNYKQAREKSFAKAMEELKAITPRHEPVKHSIDLIKYAKEEFGDLDTSHKVPQTQE